MRACERERQTDREARLYLLRVASRRGASRRAGGVDERTATIGASSRCARGCTRAHPGLSVRDSLTVCVHTCTRVPARLDGLGTRNFSFSLFGLLHTALNILEIGHSVHIVAKVSLISRAGPEPATLALLGLQYGEWARILMDT